jgi:Flp pilus assembly protein TadG
MHSIDWFIIRLAAPLRRLRSDTRGVVAVVIALAIPVLLGFAALGVDTSVWSSAKNSAQGAADAAALSAVAAATAGSSSTQIQNEVYASAASAGFTNGTGGVTVTVNNPPKSGPNTSNTGAYEVIVTQPQKRFFGALLSSAPTISGRAVAIVAGSPACILALDPLASAVDDTLSGGATIVAKKCAVAANSSNSSAVTLSGGSSLTASNLNIVGNYSISGGATVVTPPTIVKTGAPATTDPYGCSGGTCLAVPSFSTSPCSPDPNLSGGHSGVITPGCYDGITVSGGGTLTMNPGNYVINGSVNLSGGSTVTMGAGAPSPAAIIINNGSFSLSGGNTFSVSGASLVLTGSPASSIGTVNISGGANLTLTAPSSGPLQGVAVYVDRNAPANTDSFSGGSTMSITGSIYVPSQAADYSGGSSTATTCLQLIALTVSFSGGSSFGVSCGSLVVPGFKSSVTKGLPSE